MLIKKDSSTFNLQFSIKKPGRHSRAPFLLSVFSNMNDENRSSLSLNYPFFVFFSFFSSFSFSLTPAPS